MLSLRFYLPLSPSPLTLTPHFVAICFEAPYAGRNYRDIGETIQDDSHQKSRLFLLAGGFTVSTGQVFRVKDHRRHG